ncbi:uncharacterized protein LOC108962686 isoform X1 [Serinus canaria]|uniref:uncharacterized protein LOC108962686 isoform X1 n=1 Tax=Serinus canaria TaxID=9135 RepID=UPI0011AEAEF0|nr:uncharacterized protein LOC108962686 isoform X1 [Serinus canaria]XP_030089262.1 uncharacterized protein LOC108962686 isoform X1 [Serinus canaria]XP_030089263.1 uncharacterized protein LOC108962686 isoform X1 [Serinus canaria]
MDSPHLLHLGFLLLALAAPPPSIAMSNVDPTKGTQGSTTMAVYYCKDYESCKCKNGKINFENFTKIAEIKNKINTIPDVTVELVTNKSHITVCFEQANSHLEGIYGIFSDETDPPKLWCGILNSGENGGGTISPEDKNVCCEAEADAWQHTPKLKCYIQKPRPKHTALPVAIAGNPEFLTSKKNSLGILLAFLFVGVCTGWGTMFYFLRLRRHQASRQDRQASDREKLTHP